LRHNPVPHVLFASPRPDVEVPEGLAIESFEATENPYIDKIANMRRSPFERTIYLDTDTYVVGDITHVFELFDRYDVAVAHAPGIRRMPDPRVPGAFCEFNTGLVAWRANETTAALLSCWQETYCAWLRDPPFASAGDRRGTADQPAFRRCAWEHPAQIAILPPEYNYRPSIPGSLVGPVLVIHGRLGDYESVAAKLNAGVGPRSFPATSGSGANLPDARATPQLQGPQQAAPPPPAGPRGVVQALRRRLQRLP
jgi:hypothetical protein